jgi:hypothetical protein
MDGKAHQHDAFNVMNTMLVDIPAGYISIRHSEAQLLNFSFSYVKIGNLNEYVAVWPSALSKSCNMFCVC